MEYKELIKKIQFDEKGLVPAVAQDINTKKVLMLAYMNEESIKKTLEEKKVCYYSRSREKLWTKGETSGNFQILKNFSYDCDGDTILLEVEQKGPACHTGKYSCFHNYVVKDEDKKEDIINKIYDTIIDRKNNPVENSYTNYLLEEGLDKILKKIAEESGEVIIASKNEDKSELIYEISDLVYHTLVLMVEKNVNIGEIKGELYKRHK
ncbi:MAG TPA: bifunctional phosphoribosyl-AMP cyclohydrolase/phosphoribosyl-ATP pyrophosphatase [Clostridiales bacterium]|jgi:phosphoribosyl-ATP pyrophosphohydrolase/phosphoribosyl-AMP cyclohydrolase|nr:bifunctional phosphoribosyl-AMP cyclohydrolase/phosphoribosyl-ATP pyrophosphatase [Clostridiales bacterium]